MFGLSISEILFLAVLALVVIGPKQLPEVARMVGRFLTELRRMTNSVTSEMSRSVMDDVKKQPKPQAQPTTPAPPQPVMKTPEGSTPVTAAAHQGSEPSAAAKSDVEKKV